MLVYKNELYILGADDKTLDVIDTTLDTIVKQITLSSNQFPSKITRVGNSNIAVVTDAKAGVYSVIDLDKKIVIKTNQLDVPVSSIVITNKIKKIGK